MPKTVRIDIWGDALRDLGGNFNWDHMNMVKPGVSRADADAVLAKGANLDPVAASLFLWSIRRQLWRDLIGAGRLTVEFEHTELCERVRVDEANPDITHYHEIETDADGPCLDFLGPNGERNHVLMADSSPWPEATSESGRPFGPSGYPYDIPAGRRHDWDEFTMVTVKDVWEVWEVGDPAAVLEHSRTRTRMAVLPSPVLDEYSWSGLARSDQLHVMNAVIEVAERNEARDIFVAMAAHPGSSPQLALFTRALEPLVRKVLGRPR